MSPDRLFLDANVLFSAAYRENSRLAALWSLPNVSLHSSTYAVEEATRNLQQPDQHHRLHQRLEEVELVSAFAVPISILKGISLPEKDLPILAGAMSAKCSHLITGDLQHFGDYFGTRIADILVLPPADYLRSASRTI